jgi:hypothetical protein
MSQISYLKSPEISIFQRMIVMITISKKLPESFEYSKKIFNMVYEK